MLHTDLFSLAHSCDKPGCKKALVVDGNMKNHRDVCMATNAGYVEFKGLPGQVRTGCPNTPGYKSLYCSVHKPAMAQPQRYEVEEQGDCQLSPNDVKPSGSIKAPQEPIGMITGRKSTRNSTFYQVYFHIHTCTDFLKK